MSDPRDRAAARAPATLGEGCLRRFDPESMDETVGTEFSEAAALWKEQMLSDENHLSPANVAPPALG